MILYSGRKDCLNNFGGPRLLINRLDQKPQRRLSHLGSLQGEQKPPLDEWLDIR